MPRAALAIAVLPALESLLSAVVADGMTIGERHDPNRELFGQGLAGILMVGAVRMVEREPFSVIVRSTKSDASVLALTMGVTILFDLILATEVGLVAAGVLFIIRMSRMFSIDPESMSGLPRSAQHEGATRDARQDERARIARGRFEPGAPTTPA